MQYIEKPHDYPEILYKFRNWNDNFHKSVLKNNELFLASPKSFNDPFDCRISVNYLYLDTEQKIDEYIASYRIRHHFELNKSGINVEEEMKAFKHRLLHNPEQVQNEYEKDLFEMQDNHIGVLSLSQEWNNILMWSHYADNHKGYCVGFWEEKLRNSFYKTGGGGPVHYPPNNEFPIINPIEHRDNLIKDAFIVTHTKAVDWKYEKEYRMTNVFLDGIPTNKERTFKVSDDCFAEIIIGIDTPENHKHEILELAKEKGIKTFQIQKTPFKFGIKKVEIK